MNLLILDVNKVKFGDNVFIAPRCCFYTAGHPIDKDIRKEQLEFGSPIRVGNDVWIGDNVLICGGCTINDGVIIGAGSIVTRDLESYGIYAGVPAKLIRKRECSYVNLDSIPSEWWELDDHELSYLIKKHNE